MFPVLITQEVTFDTWNQRTWASHQNHFVRFWLNINLRPFLFWTLKSSWEKLFFIYRPFLPHILLEFSRGWISGPCFPKLFEVRGIVQFMFVGTPLEIILKPCLIVSPLSYPFQADEEFFHRPFSHTHTHFRLGKDLFHLPPLSLTPISDWGRLFSLPFSIIHPLGLRINSFITYLPHTHFRLGRTNYFIIFLSHTLILFKGRPSIISLLSHTTVYG